MLKTLCSLALFLISQPLYISLLFSVQNLPALVLKIMSGTFAPISDRYSPDLRQLILSMLNLDPSKRPQLNEIMAQSICIRPLLNLYTDVGSVKMRRQVILLHLSPLGGAATAHNTSDQLTVYVVNSKESADPMLGYQMCSCCKPSPALWLVAAAGVGSSNCKWRDVSSGGRKLTPTSLSQVV